MQLNSDRLLTAVLQGHPPGPESSVGKLYWANWHRDFGELMVDVRGAEALAPGVQEPARSMVTSS